MISIKSKEEIRKMAKSGAIANFALKEVASHAKPGVTTAELDKMARRLIESRGATPAFLGHEGYKFSTCISVNDELVHGLPSQTKLKESDVVGIDLGAKFLDYYSDTATTVCVGRASEDVKRLLEGTKLALLASIKAVKPGAKIGDLEYAAGEVLKKYSLSPVLSLCGHGIGKNLHEEPSVKCDGKKGTGVELKEGMVIAIEPMATLGKGDVFASKEGWGVKTKDGSLTAHFEHTVLVTATGARLLTAKS